MPAEVDLAIEEDNARSAAEAASLKKKQSFVVVLLVGLLIAILTQPKKDDVDTDTVAETKSAGKTAVETPPSQPAESDESRVDRLSQVQELKRIDLSEILSFELFAPERKQLRGSVTHRVNAIYGDSTDRAALVGQSIVRQGQPLPFGGKVLQVNQDGIQVGL